MDKKYAFILALLVTLLIAGDFYVLNYKQKTIENAVVGRVIDGDTLELKDGRMIRLLNVNSPEKNFDNSDLAMAFMKKFENETISLEITGIDKYQRYLARIYSPDYINLELVKQGLASKFLVEDDELKKFDSAEKEAIFSGLGIWQKSKLYGCFDFDIKEKEEMVIIENKCSSVNLKGWMIKDESRKTFIFPDVNVGKIILYSGSGDNNNDKLFWNAGNVWNDDRDSLYLFNDKLEVVGYESYGY